MSWSPHSNPRAYGVEFTLAFALYLGLTNGLIIGLSLCYAVLPWYLSLPLRLAFVLAPLALFLALLLHPRAVLAPLVALLRP